MKEDEGGFSFFFGIFENSMLFKIVRELKIIEDGEEIKLFFSFGYLKILKINFIKIVHGFKNVHGGWRRN